MSVPFSAISATMDALAHAHITCDGSSNDGCAIDPMLGACEACGYVIHDIPQSSDDPHDELCCGTVVCSAWRASDICVSHPPIIGWEMPF